jgi:hypothetical protein
MISSEIDSERRRRKTESFKAILGLSKAIIKPEFTIGFAASPSLIIDLINLIALPTSKDVSEFGKIVLHFDSKKKEVWWDNKAIGGLFSANFGYATYGSATYDYFKKCWGDGQIGINADKLSKNLKILEREKEIKFCADPWSEIYCIRNEKIELTTGNLETITEIPTAMPRIDVKEKSENRIKLDNIIEEEDRKLKYGAETYNLNRITSRGKRDTYPLCIKADSPGLWVGNGKNEFDLGIVDGSFSPPKEDIHLLIDKKIEALAENLKGNIILRVAKGEKTPFNPKTLLCLLKIDQRRDNPKGILKSGILLCVDNVKTESDEMMDMF